MKHPKRKLVVRWSKRDRDLVVDGRAHGSDRAWLIFKIGELRGELEQRGYDLTSLRFQIDHKDQTGLDAPVVRA